MNEPTTVNKKRGRSPSYPAINLSQAIERARTLWNAEKQYPTPVAMIMKHWGYSTLNGPASLVLAALIKFGLLEDEGVGTARTAKVSNLALNILANPNEDERKKSIQIAALKPAIHSELWEKYHEDLPSLATLRWELTQERKFTDRGADEFIREYQETVAFAQLKSDGTIVTQTTDEDEGTYEIDPETPKNVLKPRGGGGVSTATTTSTYIVPIAAGSDVAVEGPFPLTESQWLQFQSVLTAMKPALVAEREATPTTVIKDGSLGGGKDGEAIQDIFEPQV